MDGAFALKLALSAHAWSAGATFALFRPSFTLYRAESLTFSLATTFASASSKRSFAEHGKAARIAWAIMTKPDSYRFAAATA
jgi:hypothetical protein